ncbi:MULTISPECIES: DUF2235 domain-containing protein [unclassified Myroides]|uniref:T6SS phospholipase effector Tle1-like catalytic domain-containing protein n=1 Tax=unclassified Myroides TaxID=2642485 RepID=UPI0015FC83BA|nr:MULTISPECIES: DUF2235 domain-containing protein [unclassified Myroides]MBB1149626.1 DUF2235 domain-containing protein [Myroides sp. NP-2]MDM1407098.1 DUF2235 domain-containing protein [Myroides sp. DF42-4-2]
MKDEQAKQRVTGSIFFDGTGNNRTNSRRDATKFGNFTSINSLFEACVLADRIYIEGVGTRDNMDDSNWAKATGANPIGYTDYSYSDKLERALNFLKAFQKLHEADDIDLVVYGFSRGATLARDFAKRALEYPNIRIRFLGIFDTVVSLIFDSPKIHYTTEELAKIDQILHLTAINEARYYFPLTSIFVEQDNSELVNIKNNVATANIKEIFVPGAHADVGGGYTAGAERLVLNLNKASSDSLLTDWQRMQNTVKDHFENDVQNSIWKSLLASNVTIEGTEAAANLLTRRDSVSIDMTQVYFEVMASYSNTSANLTIFDFTPSELSPSLAKLKSDLLTYIQSGTPNLGPNYDYENLAYSTHISSNYGKIESTTDINLTQNTFDLDALKAEIERVKAEHPNENFDSFNLEVIENAFGMSLINVNAPNNKDWHRKVIYG